MADKHPLDVINHMVHKSKEIILINGEELVKEGDDTLGEGEFGTVKLRLYKRQGIQVAVKYIKVPKEDKTEEWKRAMALKDEIEIHMRIQKHERHENIIYFHGLAEDHVFTDFLKWAMVMQYADSGTLADYLHGKTNQFKKLNWVDKYQLALEIGLGLQHLHERDIVHRDLKSKNILIHEGKALISDFGLSKDMVKMNFNDSQNQDLVEGHFVYIDPKSLDNPDLRNKKPSDIYSYGVLLWEISSGKFPFIDSYSQKGWYLFPKISQGMREHPSPYTLSSFIDLYSECWDKNPEVRPTIENIIGKLHNMKDDMECCQKSALECEKELETVYEIGECYYKCSISDHFMKAFEKYKEAADKGYDKAMIKLATCYQLGNGIQENRIDAFTWYKKAAIYGHPDAQYHLAQCYYNGIGTEKNPEKAFKYYKMSAKGGNANALLDYYKYKKESEADEFKKLFIKYKESQEESVIKYQCSLATCYSQGIGTEQNPERAFQCYREAAKGGDADGQSKLGYCYQNGEGTDKNPKEAFKWYKRAAEGGNTAGQYSLGYCYDHGEGTDKKPQEAFKWYKRAAEGGNTAGQYRLGNCYQYGEGTDKNSQKALKWYKRAAEGSDTDYQKKALQQHINLQFTLNFKKSATYISKGDGLEIYKPQFEEVYVNSDKTIRKIYIGPRSSTVNSIKLLLVGPTGSGKTATINSFINYLYNVQFDDSFRYNIIIDSDGSDQAESKNQSSTINVYVLGNTTLENNRSVIIIDTPGFGGTRGLNQDKITLNTIKCLFAFEKDPDMCSVTAVGFVIKGTETHLSPTLRYQLMQMSGLFGKELAQRICVLFTFSDGYQPSALKCIIDAGIKCLKKPSSFNNSALFYNDEHVSAPFWELAIRSFKALFKEIGNWPAISTANSATVLQYYQNLEVIAHNFQLTNDKLLTEVKVLKVQKSITKNLEIQIKQNENINSQVIECQLTKVDIRGQGRYTTHCMKCNRICHDYYHIHNNEKVKQDIFLKQIETRIEEFRTIILSNISELNITLQTFEKMAYKPVLLTDEQFIEELICEIEGLGYEPNWKQNSEELRQQLRLTKTVALSQRINYLQVHEKSNLLSPEEREELKQKRGTLLMLNKD